MRRKWSDNYWNRKLLCKPADVKNNNNQKEPVVNDARNTFCKVFFLLLALEIASPVAADCV